MKISKLALWAAGWAGVLVGSAVAQMPGTGPTSVNAAMTKLFGDITAFSSKADVRLLNKAQKETTSMTVNFAMLERRVRMEVDMNQIKTQDLPAETLAQFKSMGMDKMVTVLHPEKRSTLVIYPGLKAYAELPMAKEEADVNPADLKVEQTKLGKETVEGQVCEKTKVVVTAKSGDRFDAVVWYAAAMKNFPVRMQMKQGEQTVTMTYREVKLEKPDATLFDAPAGFARHGSLEQLMQAELTKRLGAGGVK